MPASMAWIRLPIQPLFIYWAYQLTTLSFNETLNQVLTLAL